MPTLDGHPLAPAHAFTARWLGLALSARHPDVQWTAEEKLGLAMLLNDILVVLGALARDEPEATVAYLARFMAELEEREEIVGRDRETPAMLREGVRLAARGEYAR